MAELTIKPVETRKEQRHSSTWLGPSIATTKTGSHRCVATWKNWSAFANTPFTILPRFEIGWRGAMASRWVASRGS